MSLAIVILSVTPVSSFAEDGLIFKDIVTLTRDLQQCKIMSEENSLLTEQNSVKDSLVINLTSTKNLTESQLKSCQSQIKACETAKGTYDDTIEGLKKNIGEQKELCKKQIEAAKPSILSRIKSAITYIAAGILIGALL